MPKEESAATPPRMRLGGKRCPTGWIEVPDDAGTYHEYPIYDRKGLAPGHQIRRVNAWADAVDASKTFEESDKDEAALERYLEALRTYIAEAVPGVPREHLEPLHQRDLEEGAQHIKVCSEVPGKREEANDAGPSPKAAPAGTG